MATSQQKREWWSDWRCNTNKYERVAFPGEGRVWNLLVADASIPAWLRFVDLMNQYDYKFRESAGGTYNCRKIGGTDSWSLHAYGIALDLNPSVNSYGQSGNDFPPGFVTDVEATGLFRWGGRWNTPDPMHFEIDVPPSAIPDYPDDMALSEEDLDRIATAVVSRVLTDSANYADPPGLGRQIQLIRANVNATLKAVNNLPQVDSDKLAADIAAALELDGIPQATIDALVAELSD